jgi:Ca2+:H+ antiporter
MSRNWLLVGVPIAIALWWVEADPIVVFAVSTAALVPLAGLTEQATDSLATYLGPTWGGLLNASMGNAPEIIIGLFALRQGLVKVVKASLVGSIIGNLLFAMGISMFAGGLRHGTQKFNQNVAKTHGALLMMAAAGLIIPAVFHFSRSGTTREISAEIAITLFAVYIASLIYTAVTSRPVLSAEAVRVEVEGGPAPQGGEVGWSRRKALGVLAGASVGLAITSEILTEAIEPTSRGLGLTPAFTGVFLLALVGNLAETFNAVAFARRDKMDLSLGLSMGASLQVALVVAPLLVFFGYALGRDMDLLFTRFEIVAIVIAVLITRHLTMDGQSTWLEGLMLVAIYVMLGIGFYNLPPEGAAGP